MLSSLTIGAFGGIYDQMSSDNTSLDDLEEYVFDDYVDINSCFWSTILNNNNIQQCLTIPINCNDIPIEVQWAINNPQEFLDRLKQAKDKLISPVNVPRELFSCLETLQIACEIYYYTKTAPFKLNISSGFIRSSESTDELLESCLLPYCNPYLDFIKEYVIPIIKKKKPNVLWICGKPNIATFSIALLAKKISPNIYIGVIRHSSEYYSLNKIKHLLINNHKFFSIFDFVCLDNGNYTIKQIENYLKNNKSLYDIPNIIFTTDKGKTIHLTKEQKQNIIKSTLKINKPIYPIDVKLFPNDHCYWNKCTFCGINKKYLCNPDTTVWDCTYAFLLLDELHKKNIKQFWSIDEAIPTDILKIIAKYIIKNNYTFKWHIRSRIEKSWLDDELIDILYKSGLKNILLGFESASERILKLMNKTNNVNQYIENAEFIVKKYNKKGISIHFPAIIGFPTETDEERNKTIQFLEYLKKQYPLFTYNVNILELDVSSSLYKNFEQYDIISLFFPCKPSSFLGNVIEWRNDVKFLQNIQHQSMYNLFEWYPKNALLDIVLFYKLLEHTRMPFYADEMYISSASYSLDMDTDYIRVNDNCSSFELNDGNIVIINLDTYQYIVGSDYLKTIFTYTKWTACSTILQEVGSEMRTELANLIQFLIKIDILIIRRR